MLDRSKLYGAEEDDIVPVTQFTFTDFRALFSTPLSRAWKSTEFLDQDEFKEDSPYCTLYAAMYSFVHRFGFPPNKEFRRAALTYMLLDGIIFDKPGKRGGQPMKTASAFVKFFNTYGEKINGRQYEAKISYFNAGSEAERMLMTRGKHGFISGFKISDAFIKDRKDDLVLEAEVHGGEKHGGHSIFEAMYKPSQMIVMNNYPDKRENHFGIKGREKIRKRYDPSYHMGYSALITYWPV